MSAPLLELAGTFVALVVLLAALGAGPAALLPTVWPARARVALAPVLGLCLGVCGCTTLEWFLPAARFFPALPAAAAASLGLAAWRARGRVDPKERRGPRRPIGLVPLAWAAGELVAVCAAVFLPVATALAAHHSVGPMSYQVFDGPGYVANAEAARTVSIHAASLQSAPTSYVQRWWHLDTASSNRLDYAPLLAAVDALIGRDATQTYAAGLLAVLAVGGLGCAAAVAIAAPRAGRGFAVLAGAAFGGSFFLQLVFDGSEAALTGLVVLVPLLILLVEAARRPTAGTLAVVALATAGLATLYPIALFPLAVVVAGALAWVGLRAWRGGRAGPVRPAGSSPWGRRRALRSWVVRVVAVVAGVAVLDVVATVRDARSLSSIATGGGILSSFPAYHLGAGVVLGWLLQTRDLYGSAFGPQSPLVDLWPALLVPAGTLLVALPSLRREPVAWLALGLVAISLCLGAYEAVAHRCGYCEDRSVLSAVPPLVFLVFAGLGTALSGGRALMAVGGRGAAVGSNGHGAAACGRRGVAALAGRVAVTAMAASYLAVAAYGAANARARYAAGSIYVTTAERSLVDRLPPGSGPVELEGLGAVPSSIAAEPYLYELLVARGDRVSVATAQEGAGIAEDWGPRPLRPPWFDPSYRYVITRLGAVQLGRRRLAAAGDLTLERREGSVDVTEESGLSFASPSARLPTISGPLQLVVSGASRRPVAVRLHLDPGASGPASGPVGGTAKVGGPAARCVVLDGTSPVRSLAVTAPLGDTLLGLSAAPGRC